MHEGLSSFVTLTYAEDQLASPSLQYGDFQKFRRRVSREFGPTRFFVAGEYGSRTGRPHFHTLMFGRCFDRAEVVRGSGESAVYRSPSLEKLWPFGFSSVGGVSFASAAYVASYSVKGGRGLPVLVDPATGEFQELKRPFVQMSRRPGIGYSWFQKYYREVYGPRDGCVLPGGSTFRAPRYYDKLLEVTAPDLKEYRDFTRYVEGARFVEDQSPQRLLSREICAMAEQRMKARAL